MKKLNYKVCLGRDRMSVFLIRCFVSFFWNYRRRKNGLTITACAAVKWGQMIQTNTLLIYAKSKYTCINRHSRYSSGYLFPTFLEWSPKKSTSQQDQHQQQRFVYGFILCSVALYASIVIEFMSKNVRLVQKCEGCITTGPVYDFGVVVVGDQSRTTVIICFSKTRHLCAKRLEYYSILDMKRRDVSYFKYLDGRRTTPTFHWCEVCDISFHQVGKNHSI